MLANTAYRSLVILGIFSLSICLCAGRAAAQETCQRILVQDSTLDNLHTPAGYQTVRLGSLGGVQKFGHGPQAVLFVPGLGFGGSVIADFAARHADQFTIYAVTLPGFDGTSAPPTPEDSVSFGAQTWTEAALTAIDSLMVADRLDRPLVIGHWLTGTQIALRLAMRHPEKIRGVIIVAGSACYVPTDTSQFPPHPALANRIAAIDRYMAPKWFKTVTRETWDDNNFLPQDYAVNPIMGLRLWREAAEPKLHVWVRYLCEFYAQDVSLELDSLKVPTLLLQPGLEGLYIDGGVDYMTAFCVTGWQASAATCPNLTTVTIPQSRVFIWRDQPERFDQAVLSFVKKR